MTRSLSLTSLVLILVCILSCSSAQKRDTYRVEIDLSAVTDDRLTIEILLPEINRDSLEFRLPDYVPGAYRSYEYGELIERFEVFDVDGSLLQSSRSGPNAFLIPQSSKVRRITYDINDVWDYGSDSEVLARMFGQDTGLQIALDPTGTSFIEDSAFLLNFGAIIGHIESYLSTPIELNIKRPQYFFGATSLEKTSTTDTDDTYLVNDYYALIDGPIMYCRPDTVSTVVDGQVYHIATYSGSDTNR
ncbi:MAG: hypothetical protein JSV52_03330, partial [Candidatus Zixiibacteriota bacterium]